MKEEKKGHHPWFEWIQLIISISIPVAIAVYTVVENNRDLTTAAKNRAQDLDIAYNQRQDLIFQECLKTLGKLIEKYGREFNQSSSVSLVARFATLSALNRLDRDRRNLLVRLLYEARLITYSSVDSQPSIILHSADLTDLNLLDELDQRILLNLSLEDTIMTNADFHRINIYGARFDRAVLLNADFSWTWNDGSFDGFESTNSSHLLSFRGGNLTSATFFAATYDNVDFAEAIMIKTNLDSFSCVHCSFSGTQMNEVHLQNGIIQDSSFMFGILKHANLHRTNFGQNVDFYQTEMHYVQATYSNFVQCDLTEAKLNHTIFDHAVFINSTFSKALMQNVSMQYSKIINGNFTNADLSGSNWRYTYCEKCIFDQANFTDAELSEAIFVQSDLRNSLITDKQLKQITSLENSTFLH